MKFPEEATRWASDPEATEKYAALSALLTKHAPPDATDERSLILSLARENDAFAEGLRPLLSARHPSQLYEAALEGLALFLILFVIREKWPKAPHGLLTGLFFILYAVFRIIGENYREPDAFIHGLTEGQYYSLFMIAVGAAFLIFAATRRRAQQVSG
jgi:phosphatidylglycerol:prolipoprotein diacylglycerol transferase